MPHNTLLCVCVDFKSEAAVLCQVKESEQRMLFLGITQILKNMAEIEFGNSCFILAFKRKNSYHELLGMLPQEIFTVSSINR